ncbi:hypothetical protein [Halorussus aquaticus]|uniref:Uncharacterized protein n=1 Tax=Halorussus aquaticus TaxID=2953748 RepID=A0ABD5PXT2_9EURY|nr:hypothetical protein [Halorussus aquaticus]
MKGIQLGRKGWTVRTLFGVGGSLIAFVNDPIGFLRSELAPMVVGGILDMFTPIIDGILFLFVGSEVGYPGYPPSAGKTYGVTDVLPLVVDIALSPVLALLRMGVGGLININQAVVPSGTPFAALVVYALLVAETVILAELAIRGLRALLDSIPIGSGIETFLFGGG